MNVNSQVQIRQMLFPDSCPTPTKAFKAENEAYDPARPRGKANSRRRDFVLHGLWGEGAPGRLAVDATTDKGMAAVSSAVLWSLVGKPGAAAKALAELQQQEGGGGGGGATAADLLPDDGLHEGFEAADEDGGGAASAASVDAAAAAAGGEDGGGGQQTAAEEVRVLPWAGMTEARLAELQAEAAAKKLGKMYAAMGGGHEGLEACVALEKLIEVGGRWWWAGWLAWR
jgi:hypothetical protein